MGFKKKSTMDGTCKKDSTHTYKKDDEIFMQKKDDGSWIICNNEACFKSQGGTIEELKSKGQGRNIDMSLAFAKAFDNYAFNVALKRSEDVFGKIVSPDKELAKAEFVSRIYATLVQAFNGK